MGQRLEAKRLRNLVGAGLGLWVAVSVQAAWAWSPRGPGPEGEGGQAGGRGTYIIVHPSDLSQSAQAWAGYRRLGGWNVELLDTSDARLHRDGGAGALRSQLQRAIRERYGPAATSSTSSSESTGGGAGGFSVLLLGDAPDHGCDDSLPTSLIPTWYRAQHDRMLIGRDGIADIATDLDYQLADDSDDVPDFALGRVPARSNDEALNVLAKIKRYELGESAAGEWRKRIVYLASEGKFGPVDGLLEQMFSQLVDQIVPYDFDVSMAYAKPGSPYAPTGRSFSQVVLDRINAGALLVNYLGHGSARSLDRMRIGNRTYPILDAGEIGEVRPPEGEWPIVLFIACWTGQYDLAGGERSLAEEMLLSEGGAIGVIAGSRITHPLASASYQRHFTQALLKDRMATLGQIDLQAARLMAQGDAIDRQLDLLAYPVAQLQHWDTSPADLRAMHTRLYNLLGDPGLEVALPRGRFADFRFDMDAHGARVKGDLGRGFDGQVTVTVEARRTVIVARGGSDDRPMDEIANDKVLLRATAMVHPGDEGRFTVALDREALLTLGRRYRGHLVIKAAALGDCDGAGRVDAVDHLMVELPD